MKTAEEWVKQEVEFFDRETFEIHELSHLVKQIQLDAFKAGMDKSVLIIDELFKDKFSETTSQVMEIIIKERDRVKV